MPNHFKRLNFPAEGTFQCFPVLFYLKSCNCFHDPKSCLMNKVFESFISLYESDISVEDKPPENTQSTCDQRADLLHSGLIHAAETCSWRCNELFQKENIWQRTFYPQSDLLQSSVLQHWLGYVSVLDVLEEAVQFGAVDDCWAKQGHSTRVYAACFCKLCYIHRSMSFARSAFSKVCAKTQEVAS